MTHLDIIKAYSKAIWHDQNIDAGMQYFSSEAIIHSPVKTLQSTENMPSILQEWYQGFPDLRVDFEEYICEGDKVVSLWRATGTHSGQFLGHSATNQKIDYSGVTIYRLRDGKITEYRAHVDMQTVYSQIGI